MKNHRLALLIPCISVCLTFGLSAAEAHPRSPSSPTYVVAKNHPEVLIADPRIALSFGEEQLILDGGLQPYLILTKEGMLIAQAQLPLKPPPAKRMTYPAVIATVVSRDSGKTWTHFPLETGVTGPNLEGGSVVLANGTILSLDTYVTPGDKPGLGLGQLWRSTDDWRTVQGPIEATFSIPDAQFTGSSDDSGRVHAALRLHRRIIALPNGDLMTTLYGWLKGDNTPAGYIATMKKTRVILLRSTNGGRHWDYVSTVAADSTVGTEGFGEPVLVYLAHGPHAGRLLCHMRTGRELREAWSDDMGKTWSKSQPRVFGDLDVYATEKWAPLFRDVKDHSGKLIVDNPNEIIGAVVDPDLLQLKNGILVASFGVRVPPRACWPRAEFPWNGNYLAFSFDGGVTWTHLVRMNSGVLTTHYTAIEEAPAGGSLYYAYDLGDWRSGRGRCTYGRFVTFTLKP
ncbi:MAG: sialidase family protein [Opitutaceae bacterium]